MRLVEHRTPALAVAHGCTAATWAWGSARMCCTMTCWRPSAGPESAVARIVSAILHDDGLLHHRADALAHASCHVRLRVPDGRSVSRTSALVISETGCLPSDGEGVARQAREPIAAVLGIGAAGLQLGPDPFGGLGEGGAQVLGTAFLGERVLAGAGEPAVGEGLGAGLLERDDWEAADAEFAAADGDSLNPAAASRRAERLGTNPARRNTCPPGQQSGRRRTRGRARFVSRALPWWPEGCSAPLPDSGWRRRMGASHPIAGAGDAINHPRTPCHRRVLLCSSGSYTVATSTTGSCEMHRK